MHSATLIYFVALSIILALPAMGQMDTTTKFTLRPKQNAGPKTCTTKNNEKGLCVYKANCNNDHELETGGRIGENELRMSPDCNINDNEWCCTKKKIINPVETNVILPGPPPVVSPVVPIEPPKVTAQNCIISGSNDCPWLVKLYRADQDYAFCLGSLIGKKTILTTATCLLQGRDKFLWAQVPSSPNPLANYTIITRLSHPKYISGNRLNDIALLETLNDMDLGAGRQNGACIDPQLTLGGDCVAATINEYEDLDMLALQVTKGSCFAGGNVTDAMCGNGLLLDSLIDGAPIMCPKNNMYVLAGLTKTTYPSDSMKALLGNLDYAWLINNLKEQLNLNEADFLYQLNY